MLDPGSRVARFSFSGDYLAGIEKLDSNSVCVGIAELWRVLGEDCPSEKKKKKGAPQRKILGFYPYELVPSFFQKLRVSMISLKVKLCRRASIFFFTFFYTWILSNPKVG